MGSSQDESESRMLFDELFRYHTAEDIQSQGDRGVKMLYITPEKFNKSDYLKRLLSTLEQRGLLSRFVIDEAHCMSQVHNRKHYTIPIRHHHFHLLLFVGEVISTVFVSVRLCVCVVFVWKLLSGLGFRCECRFALFIFTFLYSSINVILNLFIFLNFFEFFFVSGAMISVLIIWPCLKFAPCILESQLWR